MSKKKNGFREWLSDNLRYATLGFAMLVILALLYIGFYFLVSLVAGTQLKEDQQIENELESEVSGEEDGEDNLKETDQTEDENTKTDDVTANNAGENKSPENNLDENKLIKVIYPQ